ncbi:MAG: hypothetical protein ICV84_03790, partial [Flavisolibacter sp.]|nr:hypothetical protein [Flavisolibacter sp.]
QWLKAKYGSEEALLNAWGKGILPEGESLANENIYPQPNHGMFTAASEKAAKEQTTIPQHIIDKAFFLFDEQNKFYQKFVQAIRATGYKGLIVSSCWQAGSGLAHLLNLYADYNAGVIDRHNYFGGGTGHVLTKGKVNNAAMVSTPGSGLLSTGFQQVKNRPFFISEWMSLIPNEWTVESAPIIAAYGLGLQGWDASFAFAMDYSRFTPTVQSGHGVYNVTSPTQLALYPALSAMVYRNDVHKGAIVAERKVFLENIGQGKLPFFERVEQESDIKRLQSSVPLTALAGGRVVLSFEDGTSKSTAGKTTMYETTNNVVTSTTGQLQWDFSGKGYFTIDTKGTQGVVGFATNKTIDLGNVQLKTSNPFAVVLVSSLEKGNDLAHAKSIIITTIARARNTGMQYNEQKTELLQTGESPVLLEPVTVQLRLKKWAKAKVYVLDHSGNRTNKTIPIQNGAVLLDGTMYKTIYYEVVYE